jgi:competence protein ComEC
VAAATVLGAMPVRLVADGWPPSGWLVVACAVGQGDLVVLPVGPGQAVVVDAGPEPAAADRCLRDLGIRSVPLLVISHFHADHVGGVAGVFRGRRVGTVVTTAWPEPAAARSLVEEAAAQHGAPVHRAQPGWSYRVGDVSLAVLGPRDPLAGTRSDPNNNSLVLRARIGAATVLLPGDAEVEQQRALLARYGPAGLRADVLKVAHHGSGYQDGAFLDAVDPAVALIPVGAGNDYGHPSPALMDRLRRDGARVLRTDTDGDIAAVRHDSGLAVVARAPPPGRPHR